jgi:hypothetical protein
MFLIISPKMFPHKWCISTNPVNLIFEGRTGTDFASFLHVF